MIITSKSNDKVKFIKSLNNKKDRNKNQAFYIEGLKVVSEILENEAINVMFIAYSKSLVKNSGNIEKLSNILDNNKNIEQIELSESIFKYVTDTISPQGILCVIKIPNRNIDTLFNDKSSGLLGNFIIIDKVQDPGNIGTILRNALAFNIKNVICVEGTTDIYSQKVLRATMGTILKLNIYIVNSSKLQCTFESIRKLGFKIVGTSLNTNKTLNKLKKAKYVFVVGNEANGVSKNILSNCDDVIKIEMEDKVESLNVGVATGILLYENYIKNKD